VLDCSAVDRDLISAELFGHEKGAFTGATHARPGAFELADRGTLFIDELGELPLDLQPKLLRMLEQREVRRLGGSRPIRVDCRLIAATHRDLTRMLKEGTFREDLFYRVAQVAVRIPPLRERREDIPSLVERFLSTTGRGPSTMSRAALRELRNVIERALALARGSEIQPADLGELRPSDTVSPAGSGPLEQAERDVILNMLRANGWHRVRTALALGISRQTLRDRMRRLGITSPDRGAAGA
jgi:DNA-binding NtrC family response regulator